MIKGSFHPVHIIIINAYMRNILEAKQIKQMLKDPKINSNTTIVGTFNTHFQQWTDHPNKMNMKTLDLNSILEQIDLGDI